MRGQPQPPLPSSLNGLQLLQTLFVVPETATQVTEIQHCATLVCHMRCATTTQGGMVQHSTSQTPHAPTCASPRSIPLSFDVRTSASMCFCNSSCNTAVCISNVLIDCSRCGCRAAVRQMWVQSCCLSGASVLLENILVLSKVVPVLFWCCHRLLFANVSCLSPCVLSQAVFDADTGCFGAVTGCVGALVGCFSAVDSYFGAVVGYFSDTGAIVLAVSLQVSPCFPSALLFPACWPVLV